MHLPHCARWPQAAYTSFGRRAPQQIARRTSSSVIALQRQIHSTAGTPSGGETSPFCRSVAIHSQPPSTFNTAAP